MAPKPPVIPSLDEQIGCVRQLLESQSFDELGISDQVRWLGLLLKKEKNCPTQLQSQWTRLNALLVHASRCRNQSFVEDYTLNKLVNTSENLCMYPKCERGKVLFRHVRVCKRSVCLLCQSMLQLVKFHAGACRQSNCRIPRCGECKEYKLRKEHRLRRNEWNDRRLKRLRRIERRLRQLYLPESRPAAAARAKVTAISMHLLMTMICNLFNYLRKTGKDEKSKQNVNKFVPNHGSLALKWYNYKEIEKLKNSFTEMLGEGGHGIVYKGKLPDGKLVAFKVLKETHDNGEEFINEVATNIANLLGFCIERKKMALVYEFITNNSLDKYIHKITSSAHAECSLEWNKLYKIGVRIAY